MSARPRGDRRRCRSMMQAGRLRPPMRASCARAGWSRSTGHRVFGPVAALHRASHHDVATRHAGGSGPIVPSHRVVGRVLALLGHPLGTPFKLFGNEAGSEEVRH